MNFDRSHPAKERLLPHHITSDRKLSVQGMRVGVRRPPRLCDVDVVIPILLQIGRDYLTVPAIVRRVLIGDDVTWIGRLAARIVPYIQWVESSAVAVRSESPRRLATD